MSDMSNFILNGEGGENIPVFMGMENINTYFLATHP